jgi:hypothetical protein
LISVTARSICLASVNRLLVRMGCSDFWKGQDLV